LNNLKITLNLQDQVIKAKVIRKGERVRIVIGSHIRGVQEFNRATLWAWIKNDKLRFSSEQVLPEEGILQIEKVLKLIEDEPESAETEESNEEI
jgi:hypothetical protein